MPPLLNSLSEPVAGYTLRERIGTGGYGEVWKADAPGGLSKAVKFVYGKLDEERANCELRALKRIKEVRHPFLLSLERIEVVDGQLVIVTELADMSLKDRYNECRDAGRPGIPRDEVVVYLRDAADALDYMNEHYSLQHLDVKPENLLILGGRVKVADFGLVREVADKTMSMLGGLTPIYASPESFQGRPSHHSDQYSLAIVFQEMLSGVLPFPGKTTVQLSSQHLHSRPRLTSLSPGDQAVIGRALAKDPDERFPSCRALIDALCEAYRGTQERHAPLGGPRRQDEPPGDTATLVSEKRPTSSSQVPSPNATQRASQVGSWGGSNPPTVHTLQLPEQVASDVPGETPVPLAPQPVADLPPLESVPPATLRPTLFVGIGGTASRTIRRLRHRLQERLGSADAIPAFDALLLDTDLHGLSLATEGDASALATRQTLGFPLRSPQEYREEADRYLHWLSRRWLYNVPRSLLTEGIRPLGRLALMANAPLFFKRLRAALAAVTAPDAMAASLRALGLSESDSAPRIVVVASICGGTGSGMVLDVAYAARQALEEIGAPCEGLCGILTHSTVRNPSARDLAKANACACLAELRYYAQRGYPGDADARLMSFDAGVPAFHDTYVVHLGDDLNEEQFDEATDGLAQYLYLDAITSGGQFLQAGRQQSPPAVRQDLEVRTFGISQIGSTRSAIPAAATEILGRSLVARWCGDGDWQRDCPCPGVAGDAPSQPASGQALPLDLDQLQRHVQRFFEQQLNGDVEQQFRAILERLLAGLGPNETRSGPQLLDAINSLLGDRSGSSDLTSGRSGQLQLALGLHLKELAGSQGQAIADWIHELVDGSASRVEGAHLASQWLAERLRAIGGDADARFRHQTVCVSQLEQALLANDSLRRARGHGWFGIGRSSKRPPMLDDRWLEYGRLRLDLIALRGIGALVRAFRATISGIGDELADLRRKLYFLADQFPETALGNERETNELSLPGTPIDPDESIADLLRRRLPELVGELDREFQTAVLDPAGGLRGLLANEGDLHGPLPARIRNMARAAVVGALRQIDLPGLLLQGPEGVRRLLTDADPRLAVCGGARRLLLICPEGSQRSSLHATLHALAGQTPSLAFDSDVNVVLCCEMQGLPLARVVESLVGPRPELAKIASRLHTRTDIAWPALTRLKTL
jgi:serine/threonine protein kinase